VLPGVGLYLDGGFGVGKTHLLASSYFHVPGPKAFATFGELTQLAGVFGFVECIDLLADYIVVRVRTGRPGQHHADLAAAVANS
jgi:cell division protein ZapE